MATCASIDLPRLQLSELERRGSISDEQLVERSLGGDEDAFRVLYERYRRRVIATVRRIVHDPEDARDVAQEVFAKVYRSLSTWDARRSKFSTWLYRLASNHAIDCWRSRRRNVEVSLDSEDLTARTGMRAARADAVMSFHPERDLEQKERIAQIRRSVESLPPLQRKIFFLRHFRGFRLQEIAASEGHKLATVKTSLYRATHVLQRRLRPLSGFGEENLIVAM